MQTIFIHKGSHFVGRQAESHLLLRTRLAGNDAHQLRPVVEHRAAAFALRQRRLHHQHRRVGAFGRLAEVGTAQLSHTAGRVDPKYVHPVRIAQDVQRIAGRRRAGGEPRIFCVGGHGLHFQQGKVASRVRGQHRAPREHALFLQETWLVAVDGGVGHHLSVAVGGKKHVHRLALAHRLRRSQHQSVRPVQQTSRRALVAFRPDERQRTQPPPVHVARQELIRDCWRRRGGRRQARQLPDLGNVDEQAGAVLLPGHRRRDADHLAAVVDQRAAAVALVDRRLRGHDAGALSKLLAAAEIAVFQRPHLAHFTAGIGPQRIDVVTASDDVNPVAGPGGVLGQTQLLHAVRQRFQLDEGQIHAGVAPQHAAAHRHAAFSQVRHVLEVVAAVGDDGAALTHRKDDIHPSIIADDVGAGDEKSPKAVEDPAGPFAGVGRHDPGDAAERVTVDLRSR